MHISTHSARVARSLHPPWTPRGAWPMGWDCGACGKAAARFTEALNRGEAAGLIHELKLNPTGLGVEPFLIALQASADASNTAGTSSSAEAMDTEDGKSPPTADKMDES